MVDPKQLLAQMVAYGYPARAQGPGARYSMAKMGQENARKPSAAALKISKAARQIVEDQTTLDKYNKDYNVPWKNGPKCWDCGLFASRAAKVHDSGYDETGTWNQWSHAMKSDKWEVIPITKDTQPIEGDILLKKPRKIGKEEIAGHTEVFVGRARMRARDKQGRIIPGKWEIREDVTYGASLGDHSPQRQERHWSKAGFEYIIRAKV